MQQSTKYKKEKRKIYIVNSMFKNKRKRCYWCWRFRDSVGSHLFRSWTLPVDYKIVIFFRIQIPFRNGWRNRDFLCLEKQLFVLLFVEKLFATSIWTRPGAIILFLSTGLTTGSPILSLPHARTDIISILDFLLFCKKASNNNTVYGNWYKSQHLPQSYISQGMFLLPPESGRQAQRHVLPPRTGSWTCAMEVRPA